MTTSIDSLAPDCPIFAPLDAAPRSPTVTYHNIIGVVPKDTWLGWYSSEEGDGVVGKKSAILRDVASEKEVTANHNSIHRNPLSILEVRRILLEHCHLQAEHQPRYAMPGVQLWNGK
jgi:hypothetical protein